MTPQPTEPEPGNTWAAQVQWNAAAGAVDLTVTYQVGDWKKPLPPPALVPVTGRPDLHVCLHFSVFFGSVEDWGTKPDGTPDIDYSSAEGMIQVELVHTATHQPLSSSLQLRGETTRRFGSQHRSEPEDRGHALSVGNTFAATLELRLLLGEVTAPVRSA